MKSIAIFLNSKITELENIRSRYCSLIEDLRSASEKVDKILQGVNKTKPNWQINKAKADNKRKAIRDLKKRNLTGQLRILNLITGRSYTKELPTKDMPVQKSDLVPDSVITKNLRPTYDLKCISLLKKSDKLEHNVVTHLQSIINAKKTKKQPFVDFVLNDYSKKEDGDNI